MRVAGPQNPYEVYCYQCNITAAAGTRRCVHCGGRFSHVPDPQRSALAALVGAEITEEGENGEEVLASIGSVAPKIALWILLVVGGFFYRFCN
jgi:hypothetical protein